MRNFDYINEAQRLLSHETTNQISHLMHSVGKQEIMARLMPEFFIEMKDIAHTHAVAGCIRFSGCDMKFEDIKRLTQGEIDRKDEKQVFFTVIPKR